MKYAHYDETTKRLLGWYSDDIHKVIPIPNIEVSDETWQEAININANCYENETFIVKDFRTPDEISNQEIKQKISEAKQYLVSTDYINHKYNEEVVLFQTTTQEAFVEKYADVYHKRAEARDRIRELEAS